MVRKPTLFIGVFDVSFILLPASHLCLVLLVEPLPSIAIGMFMVAACPGGNISNLFAI